MDDSFDVALAREKHDKIIRDVEKIRNGLTRDVIDYYYNGPTTEDEEKSQQQGIRKYLEIAQDDIRDTLNRLR